MTKIHVIIIAAVLCIATFSSCNKNKKDLKKLDQEVEDLKSQNADLQNQLTATNGQLATTNGTLSTIGNALGTNEPLKVDFATTNTSNVAILNNPTYLFSMRSPSCEYVHDNADGTYNVLIQRYGDSGGTPNNTGAIISFTYNPTTNTVTNAYCADVFYSIYGTHVYASFTEGHSGTSISITVTSFEYATGKVAANVSASTNSSSGDNYYNNQPMTATMSFTGIVPITK
jgi:hypothetical protein